MNCGILISAEEFEMMRYIIEIVNGLSKDEVE